MEFFRPSDFGYPARPPLSLPPPLYPLEVGPLAIPAGYFTLMVLYDIDILLYRVFQSLP